MYKAYSSDGWTFESPDFMAAVAQVCARLDKYGYPQTASWVLDLVDTGGDLSEGPWFYGHVGIEQSDDGTSGQDRKFYADEQDRKTYSDE